MNIKEIVDKIKTKSDISAKEYTIEERLSDVNEHYHTLIGEMSRYYPVFPASDGSTQKETFTITSPNSVFTRTIVDTSIVRVQYRNDPSQKFRDVYQDTERKEGCRGWYADAKKIYINEHPDGEIEVTYERSGLVTFTINDYNSTTPPPPSPDYLPVEFHPLLWQYPAMTQCSFYNVDRAKAIQFQYETLYEKFISHMKRNQATVTNIVTRDIQR